MSKYTRYIGVAALFGLLVLIRFFENDLFYDPYIEFFKNDYLYKDSPSFETFNLIINTVFRYTLNSIISLSILFVFFKDKSIIKFSAIIYGIAFIVLMLIYLYFVFNPKQETYYIFFNARRFLIQPIILILLLPAFYYHRIKK